MISTKFMMISLSIGTLLLKTNPGCSQDAEAESPVWFETSYVSDQLYNMHGGLRTGYVYMGMIDLALGFSTETAGWWKGGEFFFQIENTHGASASDYLLGDVQVASNIDNGNYTYLYLAQYCQQLGKWNMCLGIQDLNAQYLVSENSGNLINSSFGIMPSASLNLPVPIFPKTALGASLNYQLTDAIGLQSAVFDGNPLTLDDDPYNLDQQIGSDQGVLSVSELQVSLPNGSYKLGYLYHSGDFPDLNDSSQTKNSNSSWYVIADQKLAETGKKSLGIFFHAGMSNRNYNANRLFVGGGITGQGIFFRRHYSDFSIGFAHALLHAEGNNSYASETVFEANYRVQVHPHITLQPDLQYIVHPGIRPYAKNALAALLRITFFN